MLCLELAAHPGFVAGQRVLELGSGCGVVGIAAAAVGAAHVVLTDVEGPVLRNLRSCMHLNAAAKGDACTQAQGDVMEVEAEGCGAEGLGCGGEGVPTDAELFDEAEEVEDFDLGEMIGGGEERRQGTGSCGAGAGDKAWEAGNMSVRLLDWAESVRALEGEGAAAAAGAGQGQQQEEDMPPHVPISERFSVIVASEVMYERAHAELVAAVVAHRLAPGGRALLNCAVRELKVRALGVASRTGSGSTRFSSGLGLERGSVAVHDERHVGLRVVALGSAGVERGTGTAARAATQTGPRVGTSGLQYAKPLGGIQHLAVELSSAS